MSSDKVSCFWSLLSSHTHELYFVSNLSYSLPSLRYLIHPTDWNYVLSDIPDFYSPKAFYGSQGRYKVRAGLTQDQLSGRTRVLHTDEYHIYNITFHSITTELVLAFFHADQAHVPSGYVQCTHPRMQAEYITRLKTSLRSIPSPQGHSHTNPFSSPSSNPPPGPPMFSPLTPNGSASQYTPGKASHQTRHLLIFDPNMLDFHITYSQQPQNGTQSNLAFSPTIGHLPQLSQKIKGMEDKLHVQFNSVFQVNQNYKMEYFIHFDGKMAICCVQMHYSSLHNQPSGEVGQKAMVKEEPTNSYFKQVNTTETPREVHTPLPRFSQQPAVSFAPALKKVPSLPPIIPQSRAQPQTSFANNLPSIPSMELTLPSRALQIDSEREDSKSTSTGSQIRLPPISSLAPLSHSIPALPKKPIAPSSRPMALPKLPRRHDHSKRTPYSHTSTKHALPFGHSCENCGTTNSPEWRRGPSGEKTLCNACGLRYSRLKAKAIKNQKMQAQHQGQRGIHHGAMGQQVPTFSAAPSTAGTHASRIVNLPSTTHAFGN
ncbi:hypothetical protein CONCODRAFT_19010 [Conidiobolus coronatus NRRL 28638]|uniref:GATA-type domain-containing protein n=1 Tax=Conidiobolus coronatus (strain ATCC 28846 / CBS 209.66 / NRRL 28638) TaxID=796925 RepID=A0A137P0I5_CONC2|nr:hypothetical protein CONCODRAFT_19010 [Conidiobolus coronatus NRRL 28638]|eukprot:KXN68384.1 hypothetical protein CONCODRAFT_19010 [Conidiobolus coronatus NRRL 28638]